MLNYIIINYFIKAIQCQTIALCLISILTNTSENVFITLRQMADKVLIKKKKKREGERVFSILIGFFCIGFFVIITEHCSLADSIIIDLAYDVSATQSLNILQFGIKYLCFFL